MSTVKAQVEYPLLLMRNQNNFPTVASQSVAVFSVNRQLTFVPQSTHRVAIADFWRISHHDGKIGPGWWGWGSARPTPFTLFTITYKVACSACTLQLRRKIHYPYFISTARQYVLCGLYTTAASFKLFSEGQAFLRSYDLSSPPPPLPSISSTGETQEDRKIERGNLPTGEGEGGGRGAIWYNHKKAWASINHSILSALQYCLPYLYISTPIFI